jgi:hypothetical protein
VTAGARATDTSHGDEERTNEQNGSSGDSGGGSSAGRSASRPRLRERMRDLAMGARFATSGGRQGWLRTLLTALGVALGVAVLLLAAAVPEIIRSQDAREESRSGGFFGSDRKPAATAYTVLGKDANTHYRGEDVYGRLLEAEGTSPATPPGLRKIPASGDMVVSPALKKLLDSPEGKPLAERLDSRVVGTIGDDGLTGPAELAFYKGASGIAESKGFTRLTQFAGPEDEQPLDPVLLLFIVVACAVLMMPVVVFIATAVRFGGEQRDARLAALRLVGADAAMARRIAAGEALVGAALGLLLGGWIFLLGRAFIGRVELFNMSFFPVDVAPSLGLGLLIALGVPASAVAVTIFALRGIAIEPLGVVRKTEQRPRRLWWRLVPPGIGAALLFPLGGSITDAAGSVNETQISIAVVLILAGVALLLPWLVERIVGRLRGGPVSWQLATRRLQLSSGNASRAVSGITIAVAGAIALQMLFAVVERDQTTSNPVATNTTRTDIYGPYVSARQAEALTADLKRVDGARKVRGFVQSWVDAKGIEDGSGVTVADCATLRSIARIGRDCHEGDVFLARTEGGDSVPPPPRGTTLTLNKKGPKGDRTWRVPRSARTVQGSGTPQGGEVSGVLATPSALSANRLAGKLYQGWVIADRDPGVVEDLRTAVFKTDTSYSLSEAGADAYAPEFVAVKQAVLAACIAVLLLIGASMVVSMLEQLRERKRQLSVLVAFGTRRATLGASVLWQTAVPVVLGIGLAIGFGLGLGWGLLRLLGASTTSWLVFLPVAGAGAALIAVVTLVSLPFLWRMMRPDGLRTE